MALGRVPRCKSWSCRGLRCKEDVVGWMVVGCGTGKGVGLGAVED